MEFKKKHRMLKVKLIDGSNRTVLIDDSSLLGEILAVVCKKVQINNPDEYGLRIEGKGDSTCVPFLSAVFVMVARLLPCRCVSRSLPLLLVSS